MQYVKLNTLAKKVSCRFLRTVSHWFEATKHSVSDLSAVYTVIKRIIEVDCNNLIKKENYLRVVGIPMPYH